MAEIANEERNTYYILEVHEEEIRPVEFPKGEEVYVKATVRYNGRVEDGWGCFKADDWKQIKEKGWRKPYLVGLYD